MEIPPYFNSVNYVFQQKDRLTSAKKVKGLHMKHISRNAIFPVIFYEISFSFLVKLTESYISIVMSIFLYSEDIIIPKYAFEF